MDMFVKLKNFFERFSLLVFVWNLIFRVRLDGFPVAVRVWVVVRSRVKSMVMVKLKAKNFCLFTLSNPNPRLI